MTDRPSSPADRAARLAALQARSAAGGRRHEPPAQISKIVTTGLAASLTLGLVTAMGWSSADAHDEPAVPAAPPAAGTGSPDTGSPGSGTVVSTTVVQLPSTVPAALVTTVPVVVTQAPPPPAPAPAPAPVVIDLVVPAPAPAPAAPASGGDSGGGSSNGSTKQSK
jgi:hypothetical protein